MTIELKQKILFIAFYYFSQKGYDGVSVNDILKESGVSKGGFYHHFPSKEKLFMDVMDNFFFSYIEDVCSLLEDKNLTLDEKFQKFQEFPVDMNDFVPAEFELNKKAEGIFMYFSLLNEGIKKFENIHKKITEYYRKMRISYEKLIKEGQKKGQIRKDIDAKTWAFIIISMIEGAFVLGAIDESINMKNIYKKINKELYSLLLKKEK